MIYCRLGVLLWGVPPGVSLQKPYDLRRLVRAGCSPRVMDLWGLHKRFPDLDRTSHPLFHSPRLNRAIVVKHNLRRHETHMAHTRRPIATKLVLPVDPVDLGAGAFWMFVEAGDLEQRLVEFLGRVGGSEDRVFKADMDTLRQLAASPSFDPFVLSALFGERRVDPRYFTMSEIDEKVLRRYVLEHMGEISKLALGRERASRRSERLVAVLFGDAESQARDSLRDALRMTPEEFEKGITGWKGILYYAWSAERIARSLTGLLFDLADLEMEDLLYAHRPLRSVIGRLRSSIRSRWGDLLESRRQYFNVVAAFVHEGDAIAMKRFLLQAPHLFHKIGDDIGALTHMTSYWDYWKSRNETRRIAHDKACALLCDLAGSVVREADLHTVAWEGKRAAV